MKPHSWKIFGWALGCAALLATGVSAAETGRKPGPALSVQMSEEGPVMATPAGLTLYSWAGDDGTPGKSNCNDVRFKVSHNATSDVLPLPAVDIRRTCKDKWFAFTADAAATPGGPWSTITREDGSRQWSYEGHPLYTSIKDHRPGEVNGFGGGRRGGGWRIIFAPLGFPPGLKLTRLEEGLVLATTDGRPVYVRRGVQRVCSGCGEQLQPVRAAAVAVAGGDWSIVDADGGRPQYAYKGQPLYRAPEGGLGDAAGWTPALYRPTAGRPADIGTQLSIIGEVYTTKTGQALYTFNCGSGTPDDLSCDDPGDPAAYWSIICGSAADCAARWPLLRAPAGARPVGDWSVVEVAYPLYGDPAGLTNIPGKGGSTIKAWAWRGRPVHTFIEDAKDGIPGQVLGHNVLFSFSGFDALRVAADPEE